MKPQQDSSGLGNSGHTVVVEKVRLEYTESEVRHKSNIASDRVWLSRSGECCASEYSRARASVLSGPTHSSAETLEKGACR